MKADIHPKYDYVLFKDGLTGTTFLGRSTMSSREKAKHTDGKEYPLITLDITRYSHPFYTGQQKFVDAAGRIEKFNRKYKK